jgi:hypothetical protein
VAYNPNGMEITYEQDGMMVSEIISAQWLLDMEISVKVDVSPANPYSKYAQEMSLQNLFQMGAITFDEYVEVLDDSAVMPKAKLERILEARRAKQEEQMQEMQMQEMQNMQAQEQVAEAETLGAQEAADIAELQSLIMA